MDVDRYQGSVGYTFIEIFKTSDRNDSADRSHKPKGPTKGRLPFKGPSRGGFGSKGAFGIRR